MRYIVVREDMKCRCLEAIHLLEVELSLWLGFEVWRIEAAKEKKTESGRGYLA